MEYAVKITETLVKIVKTEAKSEEEAKSKVTEAYLDEEVILGADDYAYHDIETLEDYEDDPWATEWPEII